MSYKCTFEIPFQSYRLLLGMKSLKNLEVLDVKTHQNMSINNAIEYETVCKMVVHAYDLFLEIQHLYKLEQNKHGHNITIDSECPAEDEYFSYKGKRWRCIEIRLPLHVYACSDDDEEIKSLIPITKIDFVHPF